MQPSEIVTAVMLSFAFFYLLAEIVFNLNDIDNDTSNLIILEWSQDKLFFIPFALGAVAGHLFLGTRNPDFKMSSGLYPVFILFGIAIVATIIGFTVKFKKTKLFLTVLLVLGLLYGHFFWSMNYVITEAK